MDLFGDPTVWLPLVFAALMGLSILIYVVLDGFDLGVGILLPQAAPQDRDRMIASIGPFWDANETWLVLAVGLLLVAFPVAHGEILTALYLPCAVMLLGLILRGVSFEFRAKAPPHRKTMWDNAFFIGSTLTSLAQGFMLGLYIMGLEHTWWTLSFAALTAVFLTVGYSLIGACWLILKTEGNLQTMAVDWARRAKWGALLGVAAISIATPLVSERIFAKWFSVPEFLFLAPLPVASGALFLILWLALRDAPDARERWTWVPFASVTSLMILAFAGMAYSFYPYVVPERMTLYESASAPESLFIILIGTCFVLPTIIGYSALAYWIFRGKAKALSYD
ncbi:MAG: cytochrome d ubiquinol oxidase subunit II [Pseudomonadota bacterium]